MMTKLEAIIQPSRFEAVKEVLTELGIGGMTITDVRGHGRQKGHKIVYRGNEYDTGLVPKIMLEIVSDDTWIDDVIKVVIETARTGEIGDGRIFVLPIEESYHVRTGFMDV